jgi:Uri superfamily endonuclease
VNQNGHSSSFERSTDTPGINRGNHNTLRARRKALGVSLCTNDTAEFPNTPGTYVLWLRIDTVLTVEVGRLGMLEIQPGVVVYVGSAHGPGGLRARLRRHLRTKKTRHWHIDALTTAVPVVGVWYVASPERLECHWAAQIAAQDGVGEPITGFGASDCACNTHLFNVSSDHLRVVWEALDHPVTLAHDAGFTFSA